MLNADREEGNITHILGSKYSYVQEYENRTRRLLHEIGVAESVSCGSPVAHKTVHEDGHQTSTTSEVFSQHHKKGLQLHHRLTKAVRELKVTALQMANNYQIFLQVNLRFAPTINEHRQSLQFCRTRHGCCCLKEMIRKLVLILLWVKSGMSTI